MQCRRMGSAPPGPPSSAPPTLAPAPAASLSLAQRHHHHHRRPHARLLWIGRIDARTHILMAMASLGSAAAWADACLAASSSSSSLLPPRDALEGLHALLAAHPETVARDLPRSRRHALAQALLGADAPSSARRAVLDVLRLLTRLPGGTQPLATPEAVRRLVMADVAPCVPPGAGTLSPVASDAEASSRAPSPVPVAAAAVAPADPHSHPHPDTWPHWPVADAALRILNNLLLLHPSLRPGLAPHANVMLSVLSHSSGLLRGHVGTTCAPKQDAAPPVHLVQEALDAIFLASRVLFLSTALDQPLNKELLEHFFGLPVLQRTLESLLAIGHAPATSTVGFEQPCSASSSATISAVQGTPLRLALDTSLSEVLRLLFNLTLYGPVPPTLPSQGPWPETLRLLARMVMDKAQGYGNTDDTTLACSRRLVPPLTSGLNALINFPLGPALAAKPTMLETPSDLLDALLVLLQAGMERYFLPSSTGGSLRAVCTNRATCAADGVEESSISDILVPLVSLLRKAIEDDAACNATVSTSSFSDAWSGAQAQAQAQAQDQAQDQAKDQAQEEVHGPSQDANKLHVPKYLVPSVRARVHDFLLPATLDRRTHLRDRQDFRGTLIRLLSAAEYASLRDAVGGLFLSACEGPQGMANELGYGPSIGFLLAAGLANQVIPGGDPAQPNTDQLAPGAKLDADTHPVRPTPCHEDAGKNEAIKELDPITGALPPHPSSTYNAQGGVGGTGMSESEAAAESARVMGLLEQMNRTGVMSVDTGAIQDQALARQRVWEKQEEQARVQKEQEEEEEALRDLNSYKERTHHRQ